MTSTYSSVESVEASLLWVIGTLELEVGRDEPIGVSAVDVDFQGARNKSGLSGVVENIKLL